MIGGWYILHPYWGWGYQFWSGIGSDLGEVTLIGTILGSAAVAYRKIECHQEGCHRIGRFEHGHYKLCHVHHPHVPSSGKVGKEDIHAMTLRKEEECQ